MDARNGVIRSPKRPRPRIDARLIETRRDLLVTEVEALQATGEAARFCINAHDLLTRCWSKETWRGREKLLQAAAWMLQLARRNGAAPWPGRQSAAAIVR